MERRPKQTNPDDATDGSSPINPTVSSTGDVPLSDESETLLRLAFGSDDLDEARRLLEADCAHNIPGWEMAGLPRLRVAAIKLSGGSIPMLVDSIVLAQTDVRDALVAAGFGDDIHIHKSWRPDWDAS